VEFIEGLALDPDLDLDLEPKEKSDQLLSFFSSSGLQSE
jgi:hypothetical protein